MKIPNTFYDVSVAAGSTEIINVSGRYLRVISCPNNFVMRINEVGAAFPIYTSFYLRTDEDLSRLTITNNGATTGKVQFYVAADEVGDNITSSMSITGTVSSAPSLQIRSVHQFAAPDDEEFFVSFGDYGDMKAALIRNIGAVPLQIVKGKSQALGFPINPNECLYIETLRCDFSIWGDSGSQMAVIFFR